MLNTDTSIPDNNGDVTHASPQLENGYTRIANELLENLYSIRLTWYQQCLMLFIMRVTYGFGKKSDRISLTQFRDGIKDKSGKVIVRGTGIDFRNICRLLAKLEAHKFITRTHDNYITEYSIQKNYTLWIPSDLPTSDNTASDSTTSDNGNDTPVTMGTRGTDNGNEGTTDNGNEYKRNKRNLPKETNTKERKLLRENKFLNFINECKENEKYNGLDINEEWKACQMWYEDRGKTIKSPRSALRNWLNKALEKKASAPRGNGHKPEADKIIKKGVWSHYAR